MNTKKLRIGCCITPHGFGHAARVSAVLEAVARLVEVECVLVTTVPQWFFTDSLTCSFQYQPIITDIGLVQTTCLQENLQATLQSLNDFYPLSIEQIEQTVQACTGCDLILCDVAPLGVLVARELGISSVLLENFTWDWIYKGYLDKCQGLQPHIEYLQNLYAGATHHLQTSPVCQPQTGVQHIAPISRLIRTSRLEIRKKLCVGEGQKMILLTMGGVSGDVYSLEALTERKEYVFVLGGCEQETVIADNIRCIPKVSDVYHPDLVGSADAVVGKAGYSTLAEVCNVGIPFGYILRESFRESAVLADFIEQEMAGMEIKASDLQSGAWLDQVDALISCKDGRKNQENGAVTAARIIVDLCLEETS